MVAKEYSVLIQTDKAVYKPSDRVQFRVLVLDADTKPYQYKKLEISVADAEETVVHKEESINMQKGLVFESELTVPENTFYGNWTITVEVDSQKDSLTKQTFEVMEYVLPYFEAFGDTKKFVAIGTGRIDISIYALYNFGEHVKGKAKVTARTYDSKFPDRLSNMKTFVINDILTKKPLVINLADDLKISAVIRDIIVKIEIVFEEELTGKKQSKEEIVRVVKDGEYKIEVLRPKLKFKPGFPYDLKIVVRKPDGSMTTNSGITVTTTTYHSLPMCTTKAYKQNAIKRTDKDFLTSLKSGVLDLILEPPANATAITLRIKYYDTLKEINILGSITNSREYLHAEIMTKRLVF